MADFFSIEITLPQDPSDAVWVLEIIFTFSLSFVVLSTAASKREGANKYMGEAIGAVLAAGAFCGAVMNPAVASGSYHLRGAVVGVRVVVVVVVVVGRVSVVGIVVVIVVVVAL